MTKHFYLLFILWYFGNFKKEKKMFISSERSFMKSVNFKGQGK